MIPIGTVVFQSDEVDAVDRARAFCQTRRLGSDNAKITRKDGVVKVTIIKACRLGFPDA